MSGSTSIRGPTSHTGSLLLTQQENQVLFNHLGRKCTSLSAAVVQVYGADRNSSWVKKACGVACLVKDNSLRSYFIRVFDMKEGTTVFDQELYNNFSINCSKPYFITFAGDTCQIGLNFASEEEAKKFRSSANDLLVRRTRRTEKRRDPPNGPSPLGPTLLMATVDIKNPEIKNQHYHNNTQKNTQKNNINLNLNKKDKAKGKNKKVLTKSDIGTPSNFRHVGHVGWDPNTGFDLNNLDPDLKNLFDMCGISEDELKDKETSKVIYDFIEKQGGVEAVKDEFRRQAPPPPPSRGGPAPPPPVHSSGPPPPPPPSRGRGAPPPPPPSRAPNAAPPPPPPSRPGIGAPPPPPSRGPGSAPPLPPTPQPASLNASAHPPGGAPPPPPPPPPPGPPPPMTEVGSGELPGGKSALLDQIRGGAQLKKVEQNNKPAVSSGGRGALLDQIRLGVQLKNVPETPDSAPSTPAPSAGIVGALMEVMQKRSKAIHSSDDDDNDDDEEDFEDEDEWDD